jgi:hypothetical protein
VVRRFGIVAAFWMGVGVGFGWTACMLVAFMQSKGIQRLIDKQMEIKPIRATED